LNIVLYRILFFRIEFNILNIIISSFIFGLGLDYSIFITNSCLKEYETGNSELKTYQASIILSVLTTLLGIGALVFAKHPALRSISIVSIIGVLTAVSVSFILQRSLFRKLIFQQFGSLSFRRNKKNFISEKLYHKEAILKHYRYHTTYSEAKAEFRQQREKFLKISRYFAEVDDILVLNSGIGILPLFIKIKYPQTEVYSLELDESKRVAARNAYRLRNDKILILENAQELPLLNNYIIQGDIQDSSLLKHLSKSAEMMVFLDSEMKTRWLLNQNSDLLIILHRWFYRPRLQNLCIPPTLDPVKHVQYHELHENKASEYKQVRNHHTFSGHTSKPHISPVYILRKHGGTVFG